MTKNYLTDSFEKHQKNVADEADFLRALPLKCTELFLWYLYYCQDCEDFVVLDYIPCELFDCNSPIEQIYLMAFVYCCHFYNIHFRIDPQFRLKCEKREYIVDFYFDTSLYFKDYYSAENDLRLAIECDGHEYHHNTKRQVQRDNERDYDLKKSGYDVLHFSGSQIYQNPIKCAEDTVNYIIGKLGTIKDLDGELVKL